LKEHTNTNNYLSGWNLTKILSLLLVVNVIITFYLLDIKDKETISVLIRSTAQFSFVLFMLAFSASSLYYFWKNSFTKWLLINRRYIGVSFAVSHYIHLFALLMMTFYSSFNVFVDRGLFATIGGGTAYVFITIMTITSFDSTRNLLSKKNWKRVHTIGGYFIWIIFAKSYLPEIVTTPKAAIFSVILIIVILLRILKSVKTKK
jgi:DMSO/TMAO reductase YedYZ heme-binding membrane subunit